MMSDALYYWLTIELFNKFNFSFIFNLYQQAESLVTLRLNET